jgi:hypothetical protein
LASLKYLKCPSIVSSLPDFRLNRWPKTHCRVYISFTRTSFSQAVFESPSSIFSSWILSCNIFSNFLVPSSSNRILLAPSCCRQSIARSKTHLITLVVQPYRFYFIFAIYYVERVQFHIGCYFNFFSKRPNSFFNNFIQLQQFVFLHEPMTGQLAI